MPKNLLLLTASITVGSGIRSKIQDSSTRGVQYHNAIQFYSSRLDPHSVQIVLVENSGADLTLYRETAAQWGHDMVAIDTARSARGERGGIGAAEADMFDAVSDRLRNGSLEGTRVFKVTGRLIVRNIDQYVRATWPSRFFTARLRRDLNYMDTRFFGCDSVTWSSHLTGMAKEVDEQSNLYIEHVALRRLVSAATLNDTVWCQAVPAPQILGQSGSHGAVYGGWRERVQGYTVDVASKLIRGRWI